jgi:mannose-6-phosphate isomerase-like protein (cupin superfamily)
MLEAQHVLAEDPLKQTERASLMLWEKTHTQSHHLLKVAPDAILKKRSHKHHDLSLTCLKGSAIVKVGEHRYFVQPRDTVVIPRMYAYEVRPHRAEGAFAAMAVFSPPFEGKDWVWPQEDKADKR